jgi:hypothetical protein
MNFYYIKSNTASVLTLSDPLGNLSDRSNIDWTIEKYFTIEKHAYNGTNTVFTLKDDDTELPSNEAKSYTANIRRIVCKVINRNFKYRQPRYYYEKETWKTGYNLELEQV